MDAQRAEFDRSHDRTATDYAAYLAARDAEAMPLRGVVYAVLFSLPCWFLLCVGLFAFGYLVAGIRIP